MKIEKMFNVVLSEDEMKDAVLSYLSGRIPSNYLTHMSSNHISIDFGADGFIICVDGVLPEEDYEEYKLEESKPIEDE